MIFTSVDVEALRYLRAKGEVGGELEKFLLQMISFGYQRQLTYRHRDGWFNAHVCDNKSGSLWLTSYCLSVFSQARELVTIDDEVLAAAAGWIMSHQKPDGGWEIVGWVNNRRLYGGLDVTARFPLTAFATLALANYGKGTDAALARARAYLEANISLVMDSAPALAIGAYALAKLESPKTEEAVTKLLQLAKDDEGNRTYWDPVPVETTSYAVLALFETGRQIQAGWGAAWIPTQRNSKGGFGSTQDTVMAFRALVREAIATTENTDVYVDIKRGGELLHNLRIDATNFDIVQSFALEPGADIDVSSSGKGPISIQLAKLYNVPTETLLARGGLELGVYYPGRRFAVGETIEAQATIRYNGDHDQTNMAIAEIGIPTGLRPDNQALQSLVGTQEIQRIDVKGRTITAYLDKVASGQTITIPISYTPVFPAQPVPIPSKAYDYYDPSIEALDEGVELVLAERDQEIPFLRGDANEDGLVDLADAISSLEYLFLDAGPMSCLDALDVNDDGETNIADPIALVFYLFGGGTPPANPFLNTGKDPTSDELHCYIE